MADCFTSIPLKSDLSRSPIPQTFKSMERRILYRSVEEETSTVDYYVEPPPEIDAVRWYLYPRLPKGMHWKAGDAMGGLGVMHDDAKQSFEDFKLKPAREISGEIKRRVNDAMDEK